MAMASKPGDDPGNWTPPPRGKNKERPTLKLDLMLPMNAAQLLTMVAKLNDDITQSGTHPGHYVVTAAMDHNIGRVTLTATPKVP